MTSQSFNETATRASWKTLPPSKIVAALGFSESYNSEEFARIKRGLIPQDMEDKWFVFFEDPWLYFHRSWTGACIYGLRFRISETEASCVESWVNRDPNQYKLSDTNYDLALLKFLIDAFLLGRQAFFPVLSDAANYAPGAYQHNLVGRSYPEVLLSEAQSPRQPVRSKWIRFLSWLKKL